MLFCIGRAGVGYFVSGEESWRVVFCIGRAVMWYFVLEELAFGILYWESCSVVFVSGELSCVFLY